MGNKIKKQYTALVIGAGAIGALLEADAHRPKPATHAGAYMRNPNTKLVGLVDSNARTLSRAGKLYKNVPRFSSATRALVELQPDIVSIATPPHTHVALLSLCVRHKVPVVILEKPIAATLSDAKRIVTMSRSGKTRVIVNHQRRFMPLFAKMRTEISSGKLGRIQQITAHYNNGVFNNGTHIIDALRFLLNDEVVSVLGVVSQKNKSCPTGDINIDGLVHFKGGTTLALQSFDRSYAIHDMHIRGTKGARSINQYGFSSTQFSVRPSKIFGGYQELVKTKTYRNTVGMLSGVVAHAVTCLRFPHTRTVSGAHEGYEALRVLDALKKSAKKNGARVNLS